MNGKNKNEYLKMLMGKKEFLPKLLPERIMDGEIDEILTTKSSQKQYRKLKSANRKLNYSAA
jgi:hypothetical protein